MFSFRRLTWSALLECQFYKGEQSSMLVDRLSLIVILVLVFSLNISTAQRWPLQDLLHRLRMYQSNPRVFRPQGRPPPHLQPLVRPPPPSQIHKRRKDISDVGGLSYTEKKAALKKLLLKSAGDHQKPTDSVAPLALSLLKKLKEKPLEADKQLHIQPARPLQTPPPNIINLKPSGQFSPPRNLDSGFTPFFKQSKAFDEKTYLESLTTTTPEDTTETTVEVTLSVDEATQMFGEKKEMKEPVKRMMSVNIKRKVPNLMKTPVKIKGVRRKESEQKIVPFEDVGFTKNWNFESEKFYDSADVFGVASPLEATSPTVPYTRQSQYPERESFVDWERRNTKRRQDTRDYVRTPTQKTEKFYPTSRPPRMKNKFLERNDNDNGLV